MEPDTGYIITEQNLGVVTMISGKEQHILKANLGWAIVYREDPYPSWYLMPKNVAMRIKGFRWVDSLLNGLPTRSEKEIRKEWAQVNQTYSEKLEELRKELERAKLKDEGDNGSKTVGA